MIFSQPKTILENRAQTIGKTQKMSSNKSSKSETITQLLDYAFTQLRNYAITQLRNYAITQLLNCSITQLLNSIQSRPGGLREALTIMGFKAPGNYLDQFWSNKYRLHSWKGKNLQIL